MSQSTFRFPRVLPQEQVRVTSDSDGTELVAQLRAGLNGEVPNYLGPDGVTTLYLQSEAGTATVTGDEVGDGSEAAPSGGTSVAPGVGHKAESANFTDIAADLATNQPYTVVAADIEAGDSNLSPADGNRYAIPADGVIDLAEGSYFLIGYATGTYETAPDSSSATKVSAVIEPAEGVLVTKTHLSGTGLGAFVPQCNTGTMTLEASVPGDDAATSLSPDFRAMFIVSGGTATLTWKVTSVNADATLTEIQCLVARLA
ncbi:MAG: hypothetical protein JWM40_941 [Frankiales bacterium]|nr:hypothetical protein [Frankiales bacterium]